MADGTLYVSSGKPDLSALSTSHDKSSTGALVRFGTLGHVTDRGTEAVSKIVTGTVTDSSDRSPIAGVAVRVGDGTESATTDETGKFSFRLGPGQYNVTAEADGYQTASQSVTVRAEQQKPTTAVIELAEEESAPEQIEDGTPQDIDGDGDYQDLNGNGEKDFADVVTYFDHMNDPAMTDHADAYDYNDNGEIDFADLVALFNQI
ncbi:carboxypeptidase regulatory-like domain-containing protein [Halomicrobium salinisoli]|uniref:carboxypeptidase regulatory-like domain-containing protein n=1 Tax=Halomicrobium salinisoli TaxID=2878391 RepID=UPI001CF0D2E2|nr:carboxypeptidase regulatory-like domain-containing protein [Halomicrobium salinisoli]